MSISSVTVHLDSAADKVLLHDVVGRFPVLQIGSELTLLLDQTPTATMQAIIDRLTEAVEARDAAAEIPAQVAAEDGIPLIGVPRQRRETAA